MACINSTTFYWPGNSFSSAVQLYTDSNLTTVAPDGWYQQGGIWRQMSGGILGAVSTCPACLIPCDNEVTGSGGTGQYLASASIGNAVGVVLIRFRAWTVPDRCTWSYDYDNSGTPTVASEYSSNTHGYMTGLIGNGGGTGTYSCIASDGTAVNISNAAGSGGVSFVGNVYSYDAAYAGPPPNWPATGATTTIGPYTDQASGGVTLVNGSTGWCMMVVPKPLGLPATLDVIVDGPCGGTAWDVFISCPTPLNVFTCAPSPAACADGTPDPFYTAHPGSITGTAGSVFVGDWAFEDQYGVTKKAAGTYLVGANCVTVSANGVVTSVTPCAGSC
jgi:hypothetical protein